MEHGYWAPYMDLHAHYEWSFPSRSRVLDLGCGPGKQVEKMRAQGLDAVGIDPFTDATHCLKGHAEQLPFESASFDGLLSRVSLPYTDERKAITEIGRVAKSKASVSLITHGAGYYLRYIVEGSLREKVYAARTILNTWLYVTTGQRLLSDTLYQSRSRLLKAYQRSGLGLSHETRTPTYCGLSVFLYHQLLRH